MQVNTTYNMDALTAAKLLPDDCAEKLGSFNV